MLCKGVHGYTRYMTCYVRGTWVHKVYDMLCKGVHGYIYDMLCKGGTWVHKVYGMLCKGVHGYTRYMTCYVRGYMVCYVGRVHGYTRYMVCYVRGGHNVLVLMNFNLISCQMNTKLNFVVLN